MLCNRQIFSGNVDYPEPPHAQSLFLFPIVFGKNLIHFFDWKSNLRTGQDLIICLGLRSLVAPLAPFERVGTKSANFLATESGKWELIANFSATMVTI